MSVHIAGWKFDHATYDADADILYLSIGLPREGYGETTPQGHVLRFDEAGTFCGLTLVSPSYLLAHGGLEVTLPQNTTVSPEEIKRVLAAA